MGRFLKPKAHHSRPSRHGTVRAERKPLDAEGHRTWAGCYARRLRYSRWNCSCCRACSGAPSRWVVPAVIQWTSAAIARSGVTS